MFCSFQLQLLMNLTFISSLSALLDSSQALTDVAFGERVSILRFYRRILVLLWTQMRIIFNLFFFPFSQTIYNFLF